MQASILAAAPAVAADNGRLDLRVRGLVKTFGSTPVLRGVDLDVREGEALALLGANGAGKSTLLRCCLRLVPFQSGEIEIAGTKVHELGPTALRRVRRRVGFVFQRHNLVGRLGVLDNVLHGVQARSAGPLTWLQLLAPRAWREEAMACLERVGLGHLAKQRADRLSGGQSQRVAIARALMQRPRVVFADEPVASLDPAAAEDVMELFVRLMRDEGVTFVFTTHHLDHARRYADRIVGLDAGRIVIDTPADTAEVAQLRTLYGREARDHG